jgi:coproporphyrinogen III oxidase-like Fe-S oxidoreductase
MQGIEILEGDVWGHRKDINEYYEIKPQILDRIEELKKKDKSKEEVVYTLGLETRLSEDLIKFLL